MPQLCHNLFARDIVHLVIFAGWGSRGPPCVCGRSSAKDEVGLLFLERVVSRMLVEELGGVLDECALVEEGFGVADASRLNALLGGERVQHPAVASRAQRVRTSQRRSLCPGPGQLMVAGDLVRVVSPSGERDVRVAAAVNVRPGAKRLSCVGTLSVLASVRTSPSDSKTATGVPKHDGDERWHTPSSRRSAPSSTMRGR